MKHYRGQPGGCSCLHIGWLLQYASIALLVGLAVVTSSSAQLLSNSERNALRSSPGNLVGANFHISDASMLGGDRGVSSAVAYNHLDNEYLVVWSERQFAGSTSEIVGQLLDGHGGLIGQPFQISNTVVVGDELGSRKPAIAYRHAGNEFFVVFESDRLGRDHFEIFGQRVAANGQLINDEFRVSTTMDRSSDPDVVYNESADEFLVVWQASASSFSVDLDVFGQRVDAAAPVYAEIGADFRISQMSDPVNNRTAVGPAAAYNSKDNEYTVVWHSDGAGLPNLTTEVFGQRLTAGGAEIGANDFRISRMSDAGADRDAIDSDVTYDDDRNGYLVTWTGDGGALLNDQFEVFGARLDASANAEGPAFQISDAGPLGATAQFAESTFSAADDVLLTVWIVSFGDGTSQVRGREVASVEVGVDLPFAISAIGGSQRPTLAYNGLDNEVLIVWDDEDIIGQRYTTGTNVGVLSEEERQQHTLLSNFPNPFHDVTTISFILDRPSRVTLNVADLLGREVVKLVTQMLPAGPHTVTWRAENNANGTYAYSLVTPRSRHTRLMVLAR